MIVMIAYGPARVSKRNPIQHPARAVRKTARELNRVSAEARSAGRRAGRRVPTNHGKAASSASGEVLSPNVLLTWIKRSTLPGPKTKLPPSWNGLAPRACWR